MPETSPTVRSSRVHVDSYNFNISRSRSDSKFSRVCIDFDTLVKRMHLYDQVGSRQLGKLRAPSMVILISRYISLFI